MLKQMIRLGVLFVVAFFTSNAYACHPECRWQCDNPVCPALCQVTCKKNPCSSSTCTDQSCRCASSTDPVITQCEGPLTGNCATCTVGQSGLNCRTAGGYNCQCETQCTTESCSWTCQTPISCPKPTCHLECESPAC